MKEYEIMYIIKPYEDERIKEISDEVNKIINTNSGNVKKTDLWGKKRLAYEIQDLTEGIYVLVTFTGSPSCIKELDRKLRLSEDIMRHMIISKGE